MAEESAKLRIPYLAAAQAQKHVTHNEAMTLLDTLVQLSVLDKDLAAPPGSPEEGDTYIVAASATGAWIGWDGRIARYIDGTWRSYPCRRGRAQQAARTALAGRAATGITPMFKLLWLIQGGFLKGYRSQTIGIATGLGGLINAFALWAVGDRSLISLGHAIGENWALIAGGFGLATVAAKIDRSKDQTVEEIANEALHR